MGRARGDHRQRSVARPAPRRPPGCARRTAGARRRDELARCHGPATAARPPAADPQPPPVDCGGVTELLDRDRELAAARAALDAALKGHGSVLVAEGPAGIGKSALLDAVAPAAREAGARVLVARASPLDAGFAFGVVLQLLEPVLDELDEAQHEAIFRGAARRARPVFDASASGDAGEEPGHAVLSGLTWLLAALAERAPLVLRVDDLHWSDPASLRFLEFLGRRIDDLPVLLLASARTAEPGAPQALIDELTAGPAASVLTLQALSEASATELLSRELANAATDASRLGDQDAAAGEHPPSTPPVADVAQLAGAAHRVTGGNPLLLTTLARELSALAPGAGAPTPELLTEIGGRGVARSVERRLRALGPAAITVARAAAVAGERAPTPDVLALSDLPAREARDALEALVAAQVLAPGGRAFVHPLVSAAVIAGTPTGTLSSLHRACAQRLRERGARAPEIAVHWMHAEPAGDPSVVTDLLAAARIATGEGATDAAASLLERALAEPPAADERARLLLELGEAQMRAQQPEGAARLREALASGLSGEDAARAKTALAFVLVHTDPATAFVAAEEARAATNDPARKLQLEAFTMESLTIADGLAPQLEATLAAGRREPEPSPVMLAYLALQSSFDGGAPETTLELARRAMADGSLMAHVGPGGSTWNLLTHAARFAEDAEFTERLLRDGEAEMHARGLHSASLFVNQSWGYWHRDFGSVATGAARARVGLDAVRALGLEVTIPALAAITAENLVLMDRAREADELVSVSTAAIEGTFILPFFLPARGFVHAALHRHAQAEADFRATLDIAETRGWRAPLVTRAGVRLVELLAAQGRHEEALVRAERDVHVAREAGTRGALAVALRSRARAEPPAEAIATLREAEAAIAGSAWRLEQARILHDLGAVLRRQGERTQARDVLRRALDLAAQTEAALIARRVREELEQAGGRPRRERSSGVEALTPSERRVVDLAVEGLTNRAIAETLWVTQKTVEHHLRGAYGKLGISSRAGLPQALAAAQTVEA